MKIATWNMQGLLHNAQTFSTLSAVKARMINENIDVFCLQECGDIPSVITMTPGLLLPMGLTASIGLNIRTTSRSFFVDIYYWQNPVNIRCSMAILVRSGLTLGVHLTAGGIPGTRPILDIVVPHIGANLLVANLHAPAGPIVDTCSYVAWAINMLRGVPPNYVLAGDFNISPADYALTIITGAKPAMTAITPNVPTHRGGGLLDYFETNLILPVPVAGAISGNVVFSDHLQVYGIF